MNKPKISVITWNGGFRESFHTVDFFKNQTLPSEEYEFIWVEYYDTADESLKEKIATVDNARIVFLNREEQWHVGQCLNEGIKQSLGELLVIADGDIAVEPEFLEQVWKDHLKNEDLVIYYRRWDELQESHQGSFSRNSIEHLKNVCQLNNPENYGGCVTVRRQVIEQVGGYEEHQIIGGAGAVSKELYIRLRNLGAPIMWHRSEKIYHPWHKGTLPSTQTVQQRMQAWVIKQRWLNLDTKADSNQVNMYLKSFQDRPSNENENDLSNLWLRLKQKLKALPGTISLASFMRQTFRNT